MYKLWFNITLGTIWYFPLFHIHYDNYNYYTPEQRKIPNCAKGKIEPLHTVKLKDKIVIDICMLSILTCLSICHVSNLVSEACFVFLPRYFVSYIPGGTTGMKFFTKLFSSAVTKTVSSTLPV